ncbi:MAG: hypothetical protein Q4D04_03145 [Clostridia bacterium]|nr:hypothetical protein [Clostridia bacterium]
MLKRGLMAVLILLVICLCAQVAADEGEDVTVTYTVQPASMVVPEEMLVRLTLVFEDTELIGNIRICREDGTVVANVNVDNITSGQPYVLSDTMIPTERQLNDNRVLYTVRYTRDYNQPSAYDVETSVIIEIEKIQALPGIEFTRLAAYTLVSAGEEFGIVYRVCNSGNVAITNLFITDAIFGEVARLDRLEPGERRLFFQKTSINENTLSIPRIVYSHAATSDSYTRELAPTPIIVAREDLRMVISADAYEVVASGTVKLTCNIINNGDVTYYKMLVYDDNLGRVLFPASEIKPGETYSFDKMVSIDEDMSFTFTLQAQSETGSAVEVLSNSIAIKAVTDVYNAIDIDLQAEIVSLTDTGATVNLRLTNNGSVGIRNVRLSERSRGMFKTLFIVPAGETVVRRVFTVEQSDSLAFMAEVTDNSGGVLTVLSNELAIDENTPRDENIQSPITPPLIDKVEGVSLHIPDADNTYANMILVASAVVISLIIIAVIVFARGMRATKKRESARERTIRRTLLRAGRIAEQEQAESKEIVVADLETLRKNKKGEISEHERKPGSI